MNEDLYARFRGYTNKSILALLGEIEGSRLDCKEVADSTMQQGSAKKNFAIMLSGFANAEGGIILWGVTAKKNDAQIDCITKFPGVDNPNKFESRLNELTSDALSPGISGIEHRVVRDDTSAPTFVVTVIPASDCGPHMALLGENRYYQRIGQSTLPMAHFQIADMFGRRPQASLKLSVFLSDNNLLSVNLENSGRGIAMAPYLLFSDVREPFIVSPYPSSANPNDFPLPRVQRGSRQGMDGFIGSMDHLIHPGLHLTFRSLQLPITWSGTNPPPHCHASFRFGAAGVMEQQGRLVYDFSRQMFEVLEGAVSI